MLTDAYLATPRPILRALFRWLGITDGMHDWLCDTGLCPCESAPDATAARPQAALAA